ncbi:sugar kinase [Candidatus Sumerlaeota bacterium]|nr:sugar kinase [Candidatus Sumerlaeota bacterium]
MSVLIVGSVALDDIETPHGVKAGIQGGSASYAGTSASYFAPVGIVGIVGDDYPKRYLNYFKKRNIDLTGLEIVKGGKTFHWSGYYEANDLNSAVSRDTQLNVFENFDPKLPEQYRDADYILLGNILPQLQLKVLDQVRKPKLVLLDTMNFWITGMRDELLKVFKRVDLVCINDGEARMLCDESNLIQCGRQILRMGPKYVVIKKGEHGAMLMSKKMLFLAPAYPLDKVVDPTGAGDTFAGGFLGYLDQKKTLTEDTLKQAVLAGTTMASYCCQGFGIDKTAKLKAQEIQQRLDELRALADYKKIRPRIR